MADRTLAVILGGMAVSTSFSSSVEAMRSTGTTVEKLNTDVTLSEGRSVLAAAACNGYILAMGGRRSLENQNQYSAAVDIFKATENGIERTVFESSLEVPRGNLAATTCGDYVFALGGMGANGISDVVDVFHVTDNLVERYAPPAGQPALLLDIPRYLFAAASCGNYVLAMGGAAYESGGVVETDMIELFHVTNDGIVKADYMYSMKEPRARLAAASSGDYTLAMGGNINNNTYSDTVDVYQSVIEDGEEYVLIREDVNLKLSEPRANLGAAACGEYIFAMGGVSGMNELSDAVDVFRVTSTGVEKVNIPLNLSSPRQNVQVASCGNFVLAMGGTDSTGKPVNVIDVFEVKQKN